MKKSLPGSCLEKMNFSPCPCKDFLNPTGQCFAPDPDQGTGYYWYYEEPGMFAVGQMDLTPYEDYTMEYQQPDFISVNYYDSVTAEELEPYKPLTPGCIRGHVSNEALFRGRYHRNMPVRGMELILMPGFYRDYLQTRYPGEFQDPRSAFLSIDGCRDFPELVLIFRQIQKFSGTGLTARLYYESKAAEALSLIIDRTRRDRKNPPARELGDTDYQKLEAVRTFLDSHLDRELKADSLAKIACMGQTKLRASFKQAFGCTITEYIRKSRISQGTSLLRTTDQPIWQIAESVGYRSPGRFSVVFKEATGLSPEEYRKQR